MSEELNRKVGARLGELSKVLGSGSITPQALAPLVTNTVGVSPLKPTVLEVVRDDESLLVKRQRAATAPPAEQRGVEALANQLRELLGTHTGDGVPRVKFKVFRIEMDSAEAQRVTTLQYMELVTADTKGPHEQHATWTIEWQLGDGPPRIASVSSRDYQATHARLGPSRTLFSDCTESALGANACWRSQLTRGMNHWLWRSQDSEPTSHTGIPGLAVGDVDGDGLDDLLLTQSAGLPNRLLLQNEDGTARDVSAQWGVDWIDGSRGALFVDWDNDGDRDLVVATLGNVVLAENIEQRRFEIREVLPVGDDTTSLSAADYDRDGRVDLYVCAYRADQDLRRGRAEVISGGSAQRFIVYDADNGQPNHLFRNVADWKFRDVTAEVGLDAGNDRFSFIGVWEDYDDDGDPDLYVANDYGRDNLYENHRQADGTHRFVEISEELGEAGVAFGMGATWGDYDRDGRSDLYVSNMWSAAGNHITFQPRFKADNPDARRTLQRLAQGNNLLRNEGGGRLSPVERASGAFMGRWAWAPRFVDIDNDGWEDLVVANGFVSTEDPGDL